MPERIVVHNPVGYPPKVTARPMAQRLQGLAGRTVCLLDCRFDNSGPFLEEVAGWFRAAMPEVRTITMQMRESWVEDPDTLRRIGTEADAAIAGVGL